MASLFDILQDITPNQYEEEILRMWVGELDAQLKEYITSNYNIIPDEEEGCTLVNEPSLYVEYLSHKIDFANGEFERANNHAAMYNAILRDWRERFFREHTDELKHEPRYLKVM